MPHTNASTSIRRNNFYLTALPLVGKVLGTSSKLRVWCEDHTKIGAHSLGIKIQHTKNVLTAKSYYRVAIKYDIDR